jgi:hypothetical protein
MIHLFIWTRLRKVIFLITKGSFPMNRKYIIIIIICLIFDFPVVNAEADTTRYIYNGLQVHYGFIIPHSDAIEQVSHTNPFGIEFIRSRLHTSLSSRQVFNAYWSSGLEARYFNYQYPEVLGGVFDITAFVEPVVWHHRKKLLAFRGGMGLSFHSTIYDPEKNPLNQFFSSSISFPLYVDLRVKHMVGRRSFLTLSLCYNHISNGGFKQPNKGMNFPTVALGLEKFNTTIPLMRKSVSPVMLPENLRPYMQVKALTTLKVIREDSIYPQKTCYVYGVHAGAVMPFGRLYSISAGAEVILDGYNKETLKREQRNIDYKRVSLTLGQELLFGKVVFSQALGLYVYSPYKGRNPVYQKYEISYRLNKDLGVGIFLKSHLHVAELMGIFFNYQLFDRF